MTREEKWGIAYIYSSENNTIIHVTDITGAETIARITGGMVTDRDKDKGSAFPAMRAARASVAQGASSEGLTSAQLPAAMAPTRGARASWMG